MKNDDIIIYVMLIALVIGLTLLSRKNVVININSAKEDVVKVDVVDDFAVKDFVEVNHVYLEKDDKIDPKKTAICVPVVSGDIVKETKFDLTTTNA